MIALVTGASSGIGAAAARRIAREPGWTVVVLARREDRLRALADEIGGSFIAEDLTDVEAAGRIEARLRAEHGALHLLVNNAGAAWRGGFAETGWENVAKHMELNFEAPLRLTHALLPLLRSSSPSSIVNVSSTAGRISRAKSGAYSASKFAFCGWTDALHLEERAHGVHVGLVNPGFIATEGFPQQELVDSRMTRWMVSTPEKVADAVWDAGPGGKVERYAPRPYALVPVLRAVAPSLIRKATGGGKLTPATNSGSAT